MVHKINKCLYFYIILVGKKTTNRLKISLSFKKSVMFDTFKVYPNAKKPRLMLFVAFVNRLKIL